MKVPMLDLRGQYASLRAEMEPAVLALMESQQFVLGEPVARLERALAAYSGCRFAVGVSSGTDALLCSLMALGVGYGDEVIVPTFTFFGSAGVIARTGAKPVFVDIEPAGFNLDVEQAARAVSRRTKALMPVHLFGQMARMEAVSELAREVRLGGAVVEDACQSVGARRGGKGPGQWGTCACLSFYPSKNLSAFGDGGMILCQDEALAQRCRHLRMHGEDTRYHHSMIGGNFRLDAWQAVVLEIKLRHLDGWVARRRAHAALYDQILEGVVQTPAILPGNESVYNQYVIRAAGRDELQRFLADKGIGTAIYYPVPLHLQKCFAYLGGRAGDCPVAEQACREVLALPVYPELTEEEIRYVAECLREFYQGK